MSDQPGKQHPAGKSVPDAYEDLWGRYHKMSFSDLQQLREYAHKEAGRLQGIYDAALEHKGDETFWDGEYLNQATLRSHQEAHELGGVAMLCDVMLKRIMRKGYPLPEWKGLDAEEQAQVTAEWQDLTPNQRAHITEKQAAREEFKRLTGEGWSKTRIKEKLAEEYHRSTRTIERWLEDTT